MPTDREKDRHQEEPRPSHHSPRVHTARGIGSANLPQPAMPRRTHAANTSTDVSPSAPSGLCQSTSSNNSMAAGEMAENARNGQQHGDMNLPLAEEQRFTFSDPDGSTVRSTSKYGQMTSPSVRKPISPSTPRSPADSSQRTCLILKPVTPDKKSSVPTSAGEKAGRPLVTQYYLVPKLLPKANTDQPMRDVEQAQRGQRKLLPRQSSLSSSQPKMKPASRQPQSLPLSSHASSTAWSGARNPAEAEGLQHQTPPGYYPSWRYMSPTEGVPQPAYQPHPGYQAMPRPGAMPQLYGQTWVMPGVQHGAVYQSPQDARVVPPEGQVSSRMYSGNGQFQTAPRQPANHPAGAAAGGYEPEASVVPKLVAKPSRKRSRSKDQQASNGQKSAPDQRSRTRKGSDTTNQNSPESDIGSAQKRLFVRHVLQQPGGKQPTAQPSRRAVPIRGGVPPTSTQPVGVSTNSPWQYQVAAPGVQYYPQPQIYVPPGYSMTHTMAANIMNTGMPVPVPHGSQQLYNMPSLSSRPFPTGAAPAAIQPHAPTVGYNEAVPVQHQPYNTGVHVVSNVPASPVTPTALRGQEVSNNVGYIPAGYISSPREQGSALGAPRPAPQFTYVAKSKISASQPDRYAPSQASHLETRSAADSPGTAADLPVKTYSEPHKERRSRSRSGSRSGQRSCSSGSGVQLSMSDTGSSDSDCLAGKLSSDDDHSQYRSPGPRIAHSQRKSVSTQNPSKSKTAGSGARAAPPSIRGRASHQVITSWMREAHNGEDIDSSHLSDHRAGGTLENSGSAAPIVIQPTSERAEIFCTNVTESALTSFIRESGIVSSSAIEMPKSTGLHCRGEWKPNPAQQQNSSYASSSNSSCPSNLLMSPPLKRRQSQEGVVPFHPSGTPAEALPHGKSVGLSPVTQAATCVQDSRIPAEQQDMNDNGTSHGKSITPPVSRLTSYPDLGSPPISKRVDPFAARHGWLAGSGMSQETINDGEVNDSSSPHSAISLTCKWEQLPTSSDEQNTSQANQFCQLTAKFPVQEYPSSHMSSARASSFPLDSEGDDIDVTSTSPTHAGSPTALFSPHDGAANLTDGQWHHQRSVPRSLGETGRATVPGKDLMQPQLVLVKTTRSQR